MNNLSLTRIRNRVERNRRAASLLALLLGSLILTAGAPYKDALDAAAISETNVADISKCGLLLGNGELNVIVYSIGTELHLRVSKNDVWDTRIDTSRDPSLPTIDPSTGSVTGKIGAQPSWTRNVYPTALPCTDITLADVDSQASWSSATLDLGKAVATVTSDKGASSVRVLAQSNVILINSDRVITLGGISEIVKDHEGRSISNWTSKADLGTKNGDTFLHQNIPGDADASGMDVYIVAGKIGTTQAVAVVTSRESASPLDDAVALVNKTLADPAALATHESAWNDFWSKSGVSLGDPTLQNWWYRMVYFFRCFAHANGNATGLQAAFDKLGGWHDALKFNYNIQQVYLTAGPINHPELDEPFINTLSTAPSLNRAKWFAQTAFVGSEGAFFHSDFWPFEPDPANCSTKNKHQQAYLPWGYSWGMDGHSATIFWEYYKFAPTQAHLDRIYPVLEQFALFYCSVLERCQTGADGKFWIGPSYYPENGKYGQYNTAYDITYINYCLQAAREAANLKGDAPLGARIDTILAKMPQPSTYTDDSLGGKVVEQWLGSGPQRTENVSGTIMPVFPTGQVNWFSTEQVKDLYKRTIQRVEAVTSHVNSNVTINLARARLGLGDEAIANAKYCFAPNSSISPEQPNGLFYWKNHGYYVAEQVAIARLVSELLLQSDGGIIHIFPAWPENTDAHFSNLLAEGGFEVSAGLSGGSVGNFTVKSTYGGTLRILNPWNGFTLQAVAQSSSAALPITTSNNVCSFPTVAGETYILSRGRSSP